MRWDKDRSGAVACLVGVSLADGMTGESTHRDGLDKTPESKFGST
jgi:hypothetical protein